MGDRVLKFLRFYMTVNTRVYKRKDQAWIEQKNGSVVRRLVGYGRLEGEASAAVLDQLHRQARLYVNFCLVLCLSQRHQTVPIDLRHQ